MKSSFGTLLIMFTLVGCSLARIVSISAPNVKHGKHVKVTFNTKAIGQNWADFFVVLGWANSSDPPCDNCLRVPAGSFNLFAQGHYNTPTGKFTEVISAPQEAGSYKLIAAVISVVTPQQHVVTNYFTTSVTISRSRRVLGWIRQRTASYRTDFIV